MSNLLSREKSPYLLQHADNPVDWRPWGDDPLTWAAREDKPIFFSSGYSTCHWCHVMAHESFADPEIAALMNEAFVCIKVDREERPDLDKFYMTACRLMTGGGGWPLTILMTPDKRPFFAATYIPKESRFGQIGLRELLPQVRKAWQTRRPEICASADRIMAAMQKQERPPEPGAPLTPELTDEAVDELLAKYDEQWGGFGPPPKFPIPHQLIFLLKHGKKRGRERAGKAAAETLRIMRAGGIYDHLGYGFHRYSTDRHWLLPHFEKMLYDQALHCLAYTEAYALTGDGEFGRTAREIICYVLRDLTSPAGGFYTGEDADSEGREGKFYLWTEGDIDAVLGREEGAIFKEVYGSEEEGNFIEAGVGRRTRENILHRLEGVTLLTSDSGAGKKDLESRLAKARELLFSAREKRIHPFKDDKILTDWNGLMIAALARAAAVFDAPDYFETARRAGAFIGERLTVEGGGLQHRWRDGDSLAVSFLDDYAFFIWGLLNCYDYSGDPSFLENACSRQAFLDGRFRDERRGGYYMTPSTLTDIPIRPQESYDGAIPSGNGVTYWNLHRLYRLTGNETYKNRADMLGRACSPLITAVPSAHTMFMLALSEFTPP